MNTSIALLSGKLFDYRNFKGADFTIEDIAIGLSRLCRFGGHVDMFYSVAEHSVHLHDYFVEQVGDGGLARYALLHDAVEAYVGDIPKPLKDYVASGNYASLSLEIDRVIRRRFNAPGDMPPEVKEADERIVLTEFGVLNRNFDARAWKPDVQPLPVPIYCWPIHEAESQFLQRYSLTFGEDFLVLDDDEDGSA